MAEKSLLIGDIGGTNARFAMANPARAEFSDAMTLSCADFPSADDAIRHYLDKLSSVAPDVICLAAAGPVVDGAVQITNNHWELNAADIAAGFGTDKVQLLNDFEAIAISIPQLEPNDTAIIGGPDRQPQLDGDFTIATVGPGTGLGAAGLIRRGQAVMPIVGEGGHVGFSPETPLQVEILNELNSRFDRVSIERLVSGPGIENIYRALTSIRGEQRLQLTAQEIFEKGIDVTDSCTSESIQVFFELLGQVAGDFALTFGAMDGVYLAGGIAKRYPKLLRESEFRNAFNNKGRYRELMEKIPTMLVTHDEPGLLGAAGRALEMSVIR
jgi:glucokinase